MTKTPKTVAEVRAAIDAAKAKIDWPKAQHDKEMILGRIERGEFHKFTEC